MPFLALLGPTGIGKSAIAVMLAKRLNCPILNVDVYQMYHLFNIGTGKLSLAEQDGVKHYFLSCIDPNEAYNVYQFQQDARALLARHETLIITGGSNLYLNALLFDYQFAQTAPVLPDYSAFSNAELMAQLKAVDPASAAQIHVNNRKRLLRALAVNQTSGAPLPRKDTRPKDPLYPVTFIKLTAPRPLLYQRAEARFMLMLEQGLLNEVKDLKARYPRSALPFQAIGYKELLDYLDGTTDFATATDKSKQRTRNYIKRQLTWLNQMPGQCINVNYANISQTEAEILAYLKEQGWTF